MSQEQTPCYRQQVLKEAREWIGTPYQHQCRAKGVGCDCAGLIIGVGKVIGLFDVPDYEIKAFTNYSRLPNPKRMGYLLNKYLVRIDTPKHGDIVWMQWREDLPMHLGILSDTGTLIHAENEVGKVAEHRITPAWKKRFHSYWAYKGLN